METGKYINDLLHGYQKAIIVITANHHTVCNYLEGNPALTEDISNNLKLSLKGSERLLNVLCGLEPLLKSALYTTYQQTWRLI